MSSDFDQDDEKSTVSEISEEILGEASQKSAATEASRKSLKLKLNEENEEEEEEHTTSSSSTDTQILLLSSRTKKVDDQSMNKPDNEEEEEKKRKEELAKKYETTLVDRIIDEAIEVREHKMSKLLAEHYKEAIESEEENNTDEDDDENINAIEDTDEPRFKVHIPSIDLSMEDEDDLLKTGGRAAKPEAPKPVVYNIPITREALTVLSGSLVENYYWKRMDDLKSIMDRAEDTEESIDDDLSTYFKSNLATSTPEGLEAESAFKRMLLTLVGELLYDLYLEKYETPRSVNPYLPSLRRMPKKTYFKAQLKGPSDLASAKNMITEKVLFI